MKSPATRIAVLVATALLALSSQAQTTPSTDQMIEQLKPARTRSLRNLKIEAAPVPAAAQPAAEASAGSSPPVASPAVPDAAQAPPGTPQAGSAPIASVGSAAGAVQAAVVRPSLSLLIQFDFNSANVRAESQQALANLARALNSADLADFKFAVEGHTDAKGRADYNLKLSEQRAMAVRSFLASEGVDPARLLASGKGASDLANPAQPYAAENRRVRIVNLD